MDNLPNQRKRLLVSDQAFFSLI